MSKILAIDTTGPFGSLALLDTDRGDVVADIAVDAPDGYGRVVFGKIEGLLAAHGWTISGIDCFAATSGPGSFTGVRMGLTAVKGLAEASGKPVVAVSNLAALAFFGTTDLRAPVLDARRGDIYGALYDGDSRLLQDEVVMRFPAWIAQIPANAELVMNQPELLADAGAAADKIIQNIDVEGRKVTMVPPRLAGAVAKIAARILEAGEAQDPAAVDANYVRRADAELKWRDVR